MITDYRPLPTVEYEVIYSAALEAESVRAQQRQGDPEWRSPFARGRKPSAIVLDVFKSGRPGRVWSLTQLTAASGLTLSTVCNAVQYLRRNGAINVERVVLGRGGTGRQLRAWLAE